MDRRAFIAGALAILAAPRAGQAQTTGKVHRVGFIVTTSPLSEITGSEPVHPSVRAFVQSLRSLGYVEGQNLLLERRTGEGRIDRFGDIVAELVRLRVDVIVVPGDVLPRAAKAVTTTVPIVMVTSEDPVGEGFVQSFARPGGNFTGLTLTTGPEIEAKRLELLREMLPGISRVAYLASKEERDWERPWGQSVRTAAAALGLTLVLAEFAARQYAEAFARVSRARAEALLVSPSLAAFADRAVVVELATRARVPTMFAYRQPVEVGGLMSYGPNVTDNFRRAAFFVDRILKGAKPGDLPVEQPTKFEFVLNLKTARALGVTISPALLQRADEVIE